jgi:hypothetical protein
VPTDVQGRAATGLDFDTNEVSGAQIAVLIDVMGKTERVIVAVPPAAAG